MKNLWKMLALGGGLAIGGCADSPATPTSPSLELAGVPATLTVPSIRGSEAGKFTFDADGTRRLVLSDDPIAGRGECYDICDGGGGSEDPGSGDATYVDDVSSPSIIAAYTEAHFERDVFKGHAEMTYQFADHASQDMTLMTSRTDGSTLGSAKFSSGKIWPIPQLVAQGLITEGSIFGPPCDGRGTAMSQHSIAVSFGGRTYGMSGPSQSPMMYQSKCQTTPTSESGGGETRTEATGYTPSGGLRICYRLDHYSSEGQYIYTETLYCYDTYNAT